MLRARPQVKINHNAREKITITAAARALWAGTLLLLVIPLQPLAAQTPTRPDPTFRVNAAEISIGGRVQTQFNTTSVDEEPTGEFLLRRVRLEATVKVNEIVSGKVQPDFAGNRVSLKDAYLKFDFSPAFQLLAGNAWRPFGLLEQTSSTRILPIERGLRIRGLAAQDEYEIINRLQYSDRDVGLQVIGAPEGAPLGLGYAAGVFRGPLHGTLGSEDSYQFAARATMQPFQALRLGAGWSSRDFATRDTTLGLEPGVRRGNAYELDVEYGAFAPGIHLLGEIAFGDKDPFRDEDFLGAQAWLGYRTSEISPVISTIEPIFRVSYANIDQTTRSGTRTQGAGTLLTPGINLYFGGLNRIMLNYDVWLASGDAENEGSFKAMFQLVF